MEVPSGGEGPTMPGLRPPAAGEPRLRRICAWPRTTPQCAPARRWRPRVSRSRALEQMDPAAHGGPGRTRHRLQGGASIVASMHFSYSSTARGQ